eukprot:Gb_03251 [translate_table: standard]
MNFTVSRAAYSRKTTGPRSSSNLRRPWKSIGIISKFYKISQSLPYDSIGNIERFRPLHFSSRIQATAQELLNNQKEENAHAPLILRPGKGLKLAKRIMTRDTQPRKRYRGKRHREVVTWGKDIIGCPWAVVPSSFTLIRNSFEL